jgi:predicted DNA-binding transcriptional regulator YafY
MQRIDRLVALIVLLQTRKIIRGKEIAEYFNISLRTVYRDINSICEAGVPVSAEPGEGYGIMEGYHLPPIMFTPDEAAALFTGAKLAEYFTDESIKKHGLSALTKIKSVLPGSTKSYLEKLQESVFMFSMPVKQDGFRDDVLATIQDAIVNNLVLKMEYYAVWSDSWSERKIEPLGIAYYYNHWHIIAWCRLREDFRDFRADRIRKIIKTDETFLKREHTFIEDFSNRFKDLDSLCKVTIRIPKAVSFSLKERLFPGFEERTDQQGKIILTFWSPNFDWLFPLMVSYATAIEILAPLELKHLMAERARQIAEHYSASSEVNS